MILTLIVRAALFPLRALEFCIRLDRVVHPGSTVPVMVARQLGPVANFATEPNGGYYARWWPTTWRITARAPAADSALPRQATCWSGLIRTCDAP